MRFADYFDAFNRCDDAALVRDFWTEDCVMDSAGRTVRGQAELLAFLTWAHDGIQEIMRPQHVMEQGDRIFAEIDMDFRATRDRPDFVFGPLKKGEYLTVKFFAFYRTVGGKVAHLKTMTWPVNDRVSKPEPRLGPSLEQRQAFYDYVRAFSNAQFDVFPQYYTDDVTCQLGTRTLVGRQGIVDFYSVMFQRVREHIDVHKLIVDEAGMCAHITSRFTAVEDATDFEPMPLAKGETIGGPLYVIYGLRDGKISSITASRTKAFGPLPAPPAPLP